MPLNDVWDALADYRVRLIRSFIADGEMSTHLDAVDHDIKVLGSASTTYLTQVRNRQDILNASKGTRA